MASVNSFKKKLYLYRVERRFARHPLIYVVAPNKKIAKQLVVAKYGKGRQTRAIRIKMSIPQILKLTW